MVFSGIPMTKEASVSTLMVIPTPSPSPSPLPGKWKIHITTYHIISLQKNSLSKKNKYQKNDNKRVLTSIQKLFKKSQNQLQNVF